MNFRQIEAYVKVIEFASFSKAAEAIYLSQPSVSAYINVLEKELGTTLINRSTKEVIPTLAGKLFYENAKELLMLKANTVEQVKHLLGNYSGEINILASSVPAQYILPEVLARFHAIYPEIKFNVKSADTLVASRGIAIGEAEIGFTGGIIEDGKCEFKEFMTEEMVFIAPYDKEFSDDISYPLEKLLYEHHYIAREQGSGTRIWYENFFIEQNINIDEINTVTSFDNTQSIINAVVNGLGVAVVSAVAARDVINRGLVMAIKVKEKFPMRKIYYVRKRNISHSHLVDVFAEFLEREYMSE
ncbi:MAG: selenium metabolism-associated LysR family transcriptional regulator [Oscillospiraceae bacterium]|nr:selenium metabolism-associated LysR family transcriptional regulator [Oscillospiraceae bacterium]